MYATVADMVARFGQAQMIQLSNRLGTGVVDEGVVNQAIADAGTVVDGHLAGRYTLPLATAQAAVLVGYVCDLARRNLYTNDVPDSVETRAKEAIAFLVKVGEGKLNLGATPEPTSSNSVEVVTTERRRHGIGL